MGPSCITGQPISRLEGLLQAPYTWWIQEDSIWTVRPISPERLPSGPLYRSTGIGTPVSSKDILPSPWPPFRKETTGAQLDTLARRPLWEVGLDYDHGTGHGVGSYLGVHEGPQRISKGGHAVALQPGMILSNEPGYYKSGEYGIRLENLVVVIPAATSDGEGREWFAFETITLVPFDVSLIDGSLLHATEREWLNAYHARVREVIGRWLIRPRLIG